MIEIIINHIKTQLSDNLNGQELGLQEDLLGSGILDSLGMMRLIFFIEEEFGIKVPPEDMTIENFLTVENIGNYLNKVMAK